MNSLDETPKNYHFLYIQNLIGVKAVCDNRQDTVMMRPIYYPSPKLNGNSINQNQDNARPTLGKKLLLNNYQQGFRNQSNRCDSVKDTKNQFRSHFCHTEITCQSGPRGEVSRCNLCWMKIYKILKTMVNEMFRLLDG